ncbi:uncharacterized protein LOC124179639 isoform X1 [Neodiprion fabricii]|uniref:uncharacterized protein LOC124179639 isoform X1 n=2 Tax=Neodiprion fabricii TaxID=2872261 RepID=UPI001ED9698D|nr:uncharacterized protein LOC124179639 isoform X1 [Neodiprion fabricii]
MSKMNRREDPALRQHRSRLMQLVEVTNIRPGRGNGKRRGQRGVQGSSPSNGGGGGRVTLQDIVRSDPGYTSNIEHLVFPERKNSNPNLVPGGSPPSKPKGGQSSSGMSRLAEVFVRHYARGSSQDSNLTTRKNHVNHSSSLDDAGNAGSARQPPTSGASNPPRGPNGDRRWLQNQAAQPAWQLSSDLEGVGRGESGGPAKASRRLSPSVDPAEHSAPATAPRSSDRGPNISVLHLRGSPDPRVSTPTTTSTYSSPVTGGGKGPGGVRPPSKGTSGARGLYARGAVSSSLKGGRGAPETSVVAGGGGNGGRRREDSFLSGSGGTSGELFASGNCSRELSPVRWCDREVDGVYLGRSGWVQVQQRSLDENRKTSYETAVPGTGTLPLPRRATVKLADYHCSNSEPGNCPDLFASPRPDFLALQGPGYESPGPTTPPHQIPESFSPPSITPIISPPPAFQDAATKRSSRSRHAFGKPPFLPRSNAIVDSDVISPPPTPSPPASPTRSNAARVHQQHRLASAKSLEDQSGSRRSQFVQRYKDSSSSSSSSLGFRSLDSCVNRGVAMPRLAENTDSSIEGYEDGDEDDNPSSSINLSAVSPASATLNSSPDSLRTNGERVSPPGRTAARGSQYHCGRQVPRRSPSSTESAKQLTFGSPSSSSSSSADRQGRSPTPNPFRKGNNAATRRLNASSSPDSLQTRVRRSRSLQLPERRSPGSGISPPTPHPARDHFREANEAHRFLVKIANADHRSQDRSKRHVLPSRKAQSTDSALNDELLREAEVVTEFLYGTRSRPMTRSVMSNRQYGDRRDESDQRRGGGTSGSYEVYFVPSSSKQQQQQTSKPVKHNQRPRTLQRGGSGQISGEISPEDHHHPEVCRVSPETQQQQSSSRCNTSTCNFWPYCSQRDSSQLYSPGQTVGSFPGSMKMSQSYPASRSRLAVDPSGRNSASSSPGSLEQMDEREVQTKKRSSRREIRDEVQPKLLDRERTPKSLLVKAARRSPALQAASSNGSSECREFVVHKNAESTLQSKPSPPGTSSTSSSSSDIWVTTSDRTVTKSPRNAKSSGASTPMEDAMIGSFVTLPEHSGDNVITRPGSAPAQREDSNPGKSPLDQHQRSLSLPKSFLAHNVAESTCNSSSNAGSTPWHRSGLDSQRSSPSPNRSFIAGPEIPAPHTAPVSPLHEQQPGGHGLKDRRRAPTLNKAQRRAKASSTPALLDRDLQDGPQWSAEEGDAGVVQSSTEHPIVEATIPLVTHVRLQDTGTPGNTGPILGGGSQTQRHAAQNQESVLKKFRKSFSLRFHKKGSKESSEGGDALSEELNALPLDEDDDREPPPPPAPQQQTQITMQHKEDPMNDQKFRFGPLVWRTSKERKKSSKAARNAKCNSGDSGIQIEMASGGTLTGGGGGSGGGVSGAGDSSESHDTDAPDEMDSPPALRRRVTDKSRPQSELINQILIEKFKADLQSRTSRNHHVRRTNSDLGGQRLLQWDTRSGYSHAHNYRRMLSTPSPIKTRPPRLSPRHSSNDIVTLRSNSKGRNTRTNLRRSLSQPLGINQLSPLMRAKTAGARLPGGNVLSEDEQDARCGGGTSDDEMMSDSESSVASLSDRKKSSFEQTMEEDVAILAEAVWDHVAMEPEELAFRAGDVIDVLDTIDRDWWWGSCRNEHGWFPAAFVRLRVSQEDTVEDCLAAMASGVSMNSQLRRRTSVSLLSNEQVRSSVVRELVQTERDFVKILRDVAEGYVAECRRRSDMFTEDQIEAIFINIEELLDFQSDFLKELESVIDWNAPHKSCVGECFLNHRSGFRMYSEYCNSHPMAMATLQELYQHNRYSKFFEGCRLMRGLIEIPLDGYLLTPVQRICKYPLQLAELLKYTKADHPDFEKIKEALEAMRGVAVLINERKRRMESLEKLAAWQQRVEGWEHEDLIEVSSQLIHQGEVIRVTSGMWTNNITLFLFDHQLVYCKKDILKRNTYVYKGRIYLDTSEVIDVPDGKDPQLGVTVRHCLKVYSCVRDKWLLFCCRTADEKRQWLAAMAEERRLVQQDRTDGLDFPPAARQLAKIAATRERCRPPSKPSNKTYKRNSAYEVPMLPGQQGTGTNSLGRKVGTWFTFGSSKKGARPHNQPS